MSGVPGSPSSWVKVSPLVKNAVPGPLTAPAGSRIHLPSIALPKAVAVTISPATPGMIAVG